MNQTFSLKRFSLLFKKHTADNYKTYLMAFFVLLGVLFLSMGFVAYVGGGKVFANVQIPFFIFTLLIAGSIFTSIIFSDLGNKKKAVAMLTLPASHFEKYLIGWTYSFLIFQIIFVPAFYLIALLINNATPLKPGQGGDLVMDLFSSDEKVYIVFYIYTVLHAVTLLGSIYFEKHQFIKTAFSFFIAVFIIVYLNFKFVRAIVGQNVVSAIPLGDLKTKENDYINSINLPEELNIYVIGTVLIIVAMLWTSSFYKLKEKQV